MAGVTASLPERVAAIWTAIATAVVIVAIAIVPFLTPAWVSFEQGRSGAATLTGFTPQELENATASVLRDLLLRGDFAISLPSGERVLNDREILHMRDVRSVFAGFGLVALVAAGGLVLAVAGARRLGHPERAWRAIRNGARGLAAGVIVGGVIALVAFDAAFELFHRLLFPGGSYTFDPRTERLVQLFPFAFWSETTIAVGAVALVLSIVVAVGAGRRSLAHAVTEPAVAGAIGAAEAAR
jgi:integral membrane protein (TIGR01906 family)